MSVDHWRKQLGAAQTECERLDTVRGLLFDMQEAAWESMERDDFAATTTEFDKLAHLTRVTPSVVADHAAATKRWQDTSAEFVAAVHEESQRDEPRLAPQRRVLVRPRSRGIERSR
jgi:hypothetical protein